MTSDDDVLNADIYSSQSKAEYVIASNECSYRKTSDRSPRLLSVQVSQTPGLYAGPGVYSGPGLYHNMSSLCYFIQKIINFFVVYGYQYFVYFQTKSSYIS